MSALHQGPDWTFAFSSNAFKKFPIVRATQDIAKAGYAGIEILADTPHLDPRNIQAKEMTEFQRALKETGLKVSNINAFTLFALQDTYHPSWIEANPKLRQERIEHTRAALRLAAELGCPNISTEPGGLQVDVNDRDQALAWFREGIQQVLPDAERLKVKLLIEPEPLCLMERPQEYVNFLKSLSASPWLGMNCDLGHFYCMGEDPAQVILKYHQYFSHVHLEDIAANRVHEHLLPGKGAMDFRAIFEALDEVKYEGFVTVELYPYQDAPFEAAKSALEYCRNCLEEF